MSSGVWAYRGLSFFRSSMWLSAGWSYFVHAKAGRCMTPLAVQHSHLGDTKIEAISVRYKFPVSTGASNAAIRSVHDHAVPALLCPQASTLGSPRPRIWALLMTTSFPESYVRTFQASYTRPGNAELGAGAHGVVFRAVNKHTDVEVAVKCIDKRGRDPSATCNELEALRMVDHPNVCPLLEHFETEEFVWIVMELCRGEDLCALVEQQGALSEFDLKRMMMQLLSAVAHCHALGIIHRDVKPENIMLTGSRKSVKLVDFGTCWINGSAAPVGGAGQTVLYMSPQALQGAPPRKLDDIWSIGVVMYILLTRNFLFSGSEDEYRRRVSANTLKQYLAARLDDVTASPEAVDLVRRLLAPEPLDRISAEEALRHPFLHQDGRSGEEERVPQTCCSGFPFRMVLATTKARLEDYFLSHMI